LKTKLRLVSKKPERETEEKELGLIYFKFSTVSFAYLHFHFAYL